MKIQITLFFIVLAFVVQAQENVPVLITDRPDQTESSVTVPVKSLQIETGFMLANEQTDLFDLSSITYNTTLLRYGLLDNFELRLGLEYLEEKVEFQDTDETDKANGFSPLYTGFKVKVADENGWLPEVAFLGGLILPFTADKAFKPEYVGGNMRLAFAHTLSERFSLGYNLGAEWSGNTAVPEYFYSLALGIGLADALGMFVESYGTVPEKGADAHLLDAGFTYLVLPNFQLDISGGLGLNDAALDNFISFGLTYRLPE
ncbi:MAG TPA: transporter [Salinivirga sp.]|uniref:transporter n=1 Tax=Salinivirga sp. TaxID=1970192 RepID=UPI002B466EE6|nr:transporter [Salinivirga sp.]HKK60012.1 transporter [Salinivirga sp.]